MTGPGNGWKRITRRGALAGGVAIGAVGAARGTDATFAETDIGDQPVRDLAQEIANALATGHYVQGIDNSYWAHPQNGVVLAPGVYDAGDLSIVGNLEPFPALVVTAVPGTVVIRVPEGQYLFDVPSRLNRLYLFGLTIVGGKGAVRQRFGGANVNGLYIFEQCMFDNYTECAIANNAEDQPYLRVRDCTFMAAAGAPAIGIAWGGYADGTIIEGNAFLRNKYHIKLGPGFSGSVHVLRNDFLRWDTAGPFEAALWLVPQDRPDGFGVNSGQGTIIAGNKFGNENLTPDDIRILVAPEAAGPDRARRAHLPKWTEGGRRGAFLSGITVCDSRVACNADTRSPLIRSYIAEIRGLTYANNRHDGGGHTYLCQFMGSRAGDYASLDWSVNLGAADLGLYGSPFAIGVSNGPVGPIHDPTGALAVEEEALLLPAGTDETSFRLLGEAETATAFQPYQGSTVEPASDFAGQRRAATVQVPAPNIGVAVPLAPVTAGRLSWAMLDLKRAERNSVDAVRVHVLNFGTGAIAKVFRYVLPEIWHRIRIPFTFPADAQVQNWQLVIAAEQRTSGSDSFDVARAFVHHGRAAMQDGHLRTLADGKWDGGHLVLGRNHLWEEGGQLYWRSGGPPKSPTDGVALATSEHTTR